MQIRLERGQGCIGYYALPRSRVVPYKSVDNSLFYALAFTQLLPTFDQDNS